MSSSTPHDPVARFVMGTQEITKVSPIGMFDSGVGGLTVARALMDQLPNESIYYIGDTAHGPYGPLPIAEVREHSLRIADELVEAGCKMLVIACNTATAAFLHDARERYDVPVVEVIQPAVRRALRTTRNGKIGVIGTQGTVNSGAYQDMFAISPGIEAYAVACPQFVPYVERGIITGQEILDIAKGYVQPLRDAGVDTLVLGCTHYPLLTGVLQLAMGDEVNLVSSAEETAKDVIKVLTEENMLAPLGNTPTRVFKSTGDPEIFETLASRFLPPSTGELRRIGAGEHF